MPLPSSGPISFSDFNTEYDYPATAQMDMRQAALLYYVSFTQTGSDPIEMDEFRGKTQPYYDVYEAFGATLEYYFLPYANTNPFQAEFNGVCGSKLTAPPGLKYSEVMTTYPSAIFVNSPGPACGEGT